MNEPACYDCERLPTARQRAICTGAASVLPSLRQRYVERWLSQGLITPSECTDEPPSPWTPKQPSRGLGDTVAKITTKLGIKPCGGCKKRQEALNKLVPFKRPAQVTRTFRPKISKAGPFSYKGGTPEFVTTARLMQDVRTLVSMLPPDTSRIVGVARSGVCPASMVAMIKHRPWALVRQSTGDLIDGSNGWRLTGATHSDGPVVVVDDTCMTGNSFRHVMPIVRKHYPNAMSAVIYCNPNANVKPDLWVRELPHPHVLEWNFFNSIFNPVTAFDFDGIFCEDCPRDHDDDGKRYAKFLAEAKPLFYVRRSPIELIATARLEKYRAQTLDWLKRHGMSVKELAMWPGGFRDRTPEAVAGFKAAQFKRFAARRHRMRPPMFVESDDWQARRIAQLSGGIVVCPGSGRCYP